MGRDVLLSVRMWQSLKQQSFNFLISETIAPNSENDWTRDWHSKGMKRQSLSHINLFILVPGQSCNPQRIAISLMESGSQMPSSGKLDARHVTHCESVRIKPIPTLFLSKNRVPSTFTFLEPSLGCYHLFDCLKLSSTLV